MFEGEKKDWIGAAMTRREDPPLLRGEGRFVADHTPPECLFLEFFRAPQASGRITALELDAARETDGVFAVFAAADLGLSGHSAVNMLIPGARAKSFDVLAGEQVTALGQPVVAVVAQSPAQAMDGAEAVWLDLEAEETLDRSDVPTAQYRTGDAGKALSKSALRCAVRVDHARVAPFALEPRAALAEWDGELLRVHLSTQTPFRAKEDLARILGLEPDQVQVIAPDVGGAFGGKASIYPEEVAVAFAAKVLGRPVKWVASRSEELQAATHGRGAATGAEIGLDGEGQITALRADLDFPLGAWTPYSAYAPARNAARILPGPYRVGSVDIQLTTRFENRAPMGIYRGAGRPEAVMLMERLIDKAARLAGVDPLELRRRNMLNAGDFPYQSPTGELMDLSDLPALLDRLEQESGYVELRQRQQARRAAGEVCGLGLALYLEPCGQGWETARLSLLPDGRFQAETGASAQGQGRETAFAQIVAQELGVTPDQVAVAEGDTARLNNGLGALASRSTAIGGTAMMRASAGLAALARARLASARGVAETEILQVDGGFAWGNRLYTWAEIASEGTLVAEETYTAPQEAWASGAVLAEVTIDRDTGVTRTDRITWVDDAGRVLNPMLLEGQMMGGLAQGMGHAFMERIAYDADDQLLTGSLMDYALPRATDMPGAVHFHSAPTRSGANELGAKGVGEAGCIAVPPALANAVQDALSPFTEDDLDFPLTSEKIWRAMQATEETP
ncbi:xanthine dehydrogenase family protein molybdopterin-binding subunit [Pseudooceanicola sp. HF7]|uniref:xanthine dehydrogenase family protein molybdopterin-binding subunit n=1 Tax=Pseudooceanicola sp. HF7 TaxID=2721560 RepID=UPI0034C642AE